jgi:hypothetical protein
MQCAWQPARPRVPSPGPTRLWVWQCTTASPCGAAAPTAHRSRGVGVLLSLLGGSGGRLRDSPQPLACWVARAAKCRHLSPLPAAPRPLLPHQGGQRPRQPRHCVQGAEAVPVRWWGRGGPPVSGLRDWLPHRGGAGLGDVCLQCCLRNSRPPARARARGVYVCVLLGEP